MEIAELIEQLANPRAYPTPVAAVEVRQTHISVVFLTEQFAYKVKKPVRLSFLDYSTLTKRRHFCEDEVRLNRRLAADVYLEVVPITESAGALHFEGNGTPIEWAVKMRRLPDEATLQLRVLRSQVDCALAAAIGRRIAAFHAAAESNERIASFGRFAGVSANILDNLKQAELHVGKMVSPEVFERLKVLTASRLEGLQPLIEDRAGRGVPRDTHGDLHLDHLYYFPDRPPPGDIVIVDCIEFNERFRYADPIADMAFLAMDLDFHGRRDLAQAFSEAYFEAAGDREGRALLPLYASYRAAVRGKVEGMQVDEPEIPAADRAAALRRARAHWLLALGELEAPDRRPCLVLVAGLPGAGKSTLARGIADHANFCVIRSDAIRKELTGVEANRGDIYTPEWNDRTYAECLRRTEEALFSGERVLVDANLRAESQRRPFLALARRWHLPAIFFHCQAGPETVRRRLGTRTGDVSDADWRVYEELSASWEAPGEETKRALYLIDANQEPESCLRQALRQLCAEGLHEQR